MLGFEGNMISLLEFLFFPFLLFPLSFSAFMPFLLEPFRAVYHCLKFCHEIVLQVGLGWSVLSIELRW
jgi:hypothetical protein